MTSVDDLLKVIQTVLAHGAKITVTIEGIDEPAGGPGNKAHCKVCGWKSDKEFTSDKSRARALRAHKAHCPGPKQIPNDFLEHLIRTSGAPDEQPEQK